ncbi:hypothetical protein [Bacteroides bouchesdurhonensis]|uniref:hypothetical protein n=1 Tax=Bacteroides bouchesdurhonensis TaxID=1841855 RepID=UPI0011DD5B6F|nr:hypothetical protein [Bacteroides bouchesdurhonensis]
MKKKCAFTIVAKNYIGLGQILGKSIQKYNDDIDFFIVVSDEFSEPNPSLSANVIIGKEVLGIKPQKWVDMSFKYDLTEFCTSIKPFGFRYFFDKGYDNVIYFDPDIFTFSSLDVIYRLLENKSVLIVPHIADIHVNYDGELPEWDVMSNGIYNLGFCAMRNTKDARNIVDWWCVRLSDCCFADRVKGFFTDQKWMDWIPGLLGEQAVVSRNLGLNVAPWNFFERKIITKNGKYYVGHRIEDDPSLDELVFIHFAGYDYSAFKNGEIKRKRIEGLQEYEDLFDVQSDYRDAIVAERATFDSFIEQSYSYNTFDNGDEISFFHRRIYNGLIEDGESIQNPFSIGKNTYYDRLRKSGMIMKKSNIDNLNARNISNMSRKRKLISMLFKGLYFFGGYRRYSLLVRGLIYYHRPETHTFLIKK